MFILLKAEMIAFPAWFPCHYWREVPADRIDGSSRNGLWVWDWHSLEDEQGEGKVIREAVTADNSTELAGGRIMARKEIENTRGPQDRFL